VGTHEWIAHFSHVVMLALSASILGRNVGTRLLMLNTRGVELRLKTVATKLSTTITSKKFNLVRILIFYKRLVLKKNINKIIFKFYRVESCKARVIIDKYHVICKTHFCLIGAKSQMSQWIRPKIELDLVLLIENESLWLLAIWHVPQIAGLGKIEVRNKCLFLFNKEIIEWLTWSRHACHRSYDVVRTNLFRTEIKAALSHSST